ncbi:hypothetical protein BDK51DRAFT_33892, partial [Blyttiomyces helicus]
AEPLVRQLQLPAEHEQEPATLAEEQPQAAAFERQLQDPAAQAQVAAALGLSSATSQPQAEPLVRQLQLPAEHAQEEAALKEEEVQPQAEDLVRQSQEPVAQAQAAAALGFSSATSQPQAEALVRHLQLPAEHGQEPATLAEEQPQAEALERQSHDPAAQAQAAAALGFSSATSQPQADPLVRQLQLPAEHEQEPEAFEEEELQPHAEPLVRQSHEPAAQGQGIAALGLASATWSGLEVGREGVNNRLCKERYQKKTDRMFTSQPHAAPLVRQLQFPGEQGHAGAAAGAEQEQEAAPLARQQQLPAEQEHEGAIGRKDWRGRVEGWLAIGSRRSESCYEGETAAGEAAYKDFGHVAGIAPGVEFSWILLAMRRRLAILPRRNSADALPNFRAAPSEQSEPW